MHFDISTRMELGKKAAISKSEKKKSKLHGFPSIIWNQVRILNSYQPFQADFGQENLSIFIIATDDRRSAVVHIKNGTIEVEEVKKKEENYSEIKKKIKARITTDTATFLQLAMGKINPVKSVLKGQIKLRRPLKILKFTKIFRYVKAAQKSQKNEKNEQTEKTSETTHTEYKK